MDSGDRNRSPRREEDDRVNVYFKVTKTVCLKNVKRSETIGNLKTMLREKEGISECLQELFFDGDHLNDAKNLVDCGIDKNSTVQVYVHNAVPIILSIKMPPGMNKTITVEAKPTDTIQSIKNQIRDKEGFSCDLYTLISSGKPLDDYQTLASLNIQTGSTLHVLLHRKETMHISVKMPTGEVLKPEVKLLHTISDLKTILENIVGSPLDNMELMYGGNQLQGSKNLFFYDIKEDSVLEMFSLSFPIFIKSSCGKTITLEVRQGDKIKDLKVGIARKLKVPNYFHLVFEGKRVEDGRDMGSYNIQSNCTLYLVLWPSTLIRRTRLSSTGIEKLDNTTTIADLIKRIQLKMDNPVRELIKNGVTLKGELTVGHYGITTDNVIDVALELGQGGVGVWGDVGWGGWMGGEFRL